MALEWMYSGESESSLPKPAPKPPPASTFTNPLSAFINAFIVSTPERTLGGTLAGLHEFIPGSTGDFFQSIGENISDLPSDSLREQVQRTSSIPWFEDDGDPWYNPLSWSPSRLPQLASKSMSMLGENIPYMMQTVLGNRIAKGLKLDRLAAKAAQKVAGAVIGAGAAGLGSAAATGGAALAEPYEEIVGALAGMAMSEVVVPATLIGLQESRNFAIEARKLGIDDDLVASNARMYGPISGLVEVGQQLTNIGVAKGAGGLVDKNWRKKGLNWVLGKLIAKVNNGIPEMIEEGGEEVVQGYSQDKFMQRAIRQMKDRHGEAWTPATPYEGYTFSDMANDFAGGALIAGMMKTYNLAHRLVMNRTDSDTQGEMAEVINFGNGSDTPIALRSTVKENVIGLRDLLKKTAGYSNSMQKLWDQNNERRALGQKNMLDLKKILAPLEAGDVDSAIEEFASQAGIHIVEDGASADEIFSWIKSKKEKVKFVRSESTGESYLVADSSIITSAQDARRLFHHARLTVPKEEEGKWTQGFTVEEIESDDMTAAQLANVPLRKDPKTGKYVFSDRSYQKIRELRETVRALADSAGDDTALRKSPIKFQMSWVRNVLLSREQAAEEGNTAEWDSATPNQKTDFTKPDGSIEKRVTFRRNAANGWDGSSRVYTLFPGATKAHFAEEIVEAVGKRPSRGTPLPPHVHQAYEDLDDSKRRWRDRIDGELEVVTKNVKAVRTKVQDINDNATRKKNLVSQLNEAIAATEKYPKVRGMDSRNLRREVTSLRDRVASMNDYDFNDEIAGRIQMEVRKVQSQLNLLTEGDQLLALHDWVKRAKDDPNQMIELFSKAWTYSQLGYQREVTAANRHQIQYLGFRPMEASAIAGQMKKIAGEKLWKHLTAGRQAIRPAEMSAEYFDSKLAGAKYQMDMDEIPLTEADRVRRQAEQAVNEKLEKLREEFRGKYASSEAVENARVRLENLFRSIDPNNPNRVQFAPEDFNAILSSILDQISPPGRSAQPAAALSSAPGTPSPAEGAPSPKPEEKPAEPAKPPVELQIPPKESSEAPPRSESPLPVPPVNPAPEKQVSKDEARQKALKKILDAINGNVAGGSGQAGTYSTELEDGSPVLRDPSILSSGDEVLSPGVVGNDDPFDELADLGSDAVGYLHGPDERYLKFNERFSVMTAGLAAAYNGDRRIAETILVGLCQRDSDAFAKNVSKSDDDFAAWVATDVGDVDLQNLKLTISVLMNHPDANIRKDRAFFQSVYENYRIYTPVSLEFYNNVKSPTSLANGNHRTRSNYFDRSAEWKALTLAHIGLIAQNPNAQADLRNSFARRENNDQAFDEFMSKLTGISEKIFNSAGARWHRGARKAFTRSDWQDRIQIIRTGSQDPQAWKDLLDLVFLSAPEGRNSNLRNLVFESKYQDGYTLHGRNHAKSLAVCAVIEGPFRRFLSKWAEKQGAGIADIVKTVSGIVTDKGRSIDWEELHPNTRRAIEIDQYRRMAVRSDGRGAERTEEYGDERFAFIRVIPFGDKTQAYFIRVPRLQSPEQALSEYTKKWNAWKNDPKTKHLSRLFISPAVLKRTADAEFAANSKDKSIGEGNAAIIRIIRYAKALYGPDLYLSEETYGDLAKYGKIDKQGNLVVSSVADGAIKRGSQFTSGGPSLNAPVRILYVKSLGPAAAKLYDGGMVHSRRLADLIREKMGSEFSTEILKPYFRFGETGVKCSSVLVSEMKNMPDPIMRSIAALLEKYDVHAIADETSVKFSDQKGIDLFNDDGTFKAVDPAAGIITVPNRGMALVQDLSKKSDAKRDLMSRQMIFATMNLPNARARHDLLARISDRILKAILNRDLLADRTMLESMLKADRQSDLRHYLFENGESAKSLLHADEVLSAVFAWIQKQMNPRTNRHVGHQVPEGLSKLPGYEKAEDGTNHLPYSRANVSLAPVKVGDREYRPQIRKTQDLPKAANRQDAEVAAYDLIRRNPFAYVDLFRPDPDGRVDLSTLGTYAEMKPRMKSSFIRNVNGIWQIPGSIDFLARVPSDSLFSGVPTRHDGSVGEYDGSGLVALAEQQRANNGSDFDGDALFGAILMTDENGMVIQDESIAGLMNRHLLLLADDYENADLSLLTSESGSATSIDTMLKQFQAMAREIGQGKIEEFAKRFYESDPLPHPPMNTPEFDEYMLNVYDIGKRILGAVAKMNSATVVEMMHGTYYPESLTFDAGFKIQLTQEKAKRLQGSLPDRIREQLVIGRLMINAAVDDPKNPVLHLLQDLDTIGMTLAAIRGMDVNVENWKEKLTTWFKWLQSPVGQEVRAELAKIRQGENRMDIFNRLYNKGGDHRRGAVLWAIGEARRKMGNIADIMVSAKGPRDPARLAYLRSLFSDLVVGKRETLVRNVYDALVVTRKSGKVSPVHRIYNPGDLNSSFMSAGSSWLDAMSHAQAGTVAERIQQSIAELGYLEEDVSNRYHRNARKMLAAKAAWRDGAIDPNELAGRFPEMAGRMLKDPDLAPLANLLVLENGDVKINPDYRIRAIGQEDLLAARAAWDKLDPLEQASLASYVFSRYGLTTSTYGGSFQILFGDEYRKSIDQAMVDAQPNFGEETLSGKGPMYGDRNLFSPVEKEADWRRLPSYRGIEVIYTNLVENGKRVGAMQKNGIIYVDKEEMQDAFNRYKSGDFLLHGVKPVGEFADLEAFAMFALEHERQHTLTKKTESESRVDYENRINALATESLKGNSQKSSTVLDNRESRKSISEDPAVLRERAMASAKAYPALPIPTPQNVEELASLMEKARADFVKFFNDNEADEQDHWNGGRETAKLYSPAHDDYIEFGKVDHSVVELVSELNRVVRPVINALSGIPGEDDGDRADRWSNALNAGSLDWIGSLFEEAISPELDAMFPGFKESQRLRLAGQLDLPMTYSMEVADVGENGSVSLRFSWHDRLLNHPKRRLYDGGTWDLAKMLAEAGLPKDEKQMLLDYAAGKPRDLAALIAGFEAQLPKLEIVRATADVLGIDVPAEPRYESLSVNKGQGEYREYFIRTPFPVPGQHGEFQDTNLAGWFRVREYHEAPVEGATLRKAIEAGGGSWDPDAVQKDMPELEGVIEIQEIQSELFQKNKGGFEGWVTPTSVRNIADSISPKQAAFLNLMLKDQTWVPVFTNAITQWARNQGFTKVRFPTGETAAKVEGHHVLADRLTALQERRKTAITEAQRLRTGNYPAPEFFNGVWWAGSYDDNNIQSFDSAAEAEAYRQALNRQMRVPEREDGPRAMGADLPNTVEGIDAEINELKTQGIEKLAPIEAFYEKRVASIVNRMGAQPMTDTNGNTWREVAVSSQPSTFSAELSESAPVPEALRESAYDQIRAYRPRLLSKLRVDLPRTADVFERVRSIEESAQERMKAGEPIESFLETLRKYVPDAQIRLQAPAPMEDSTFSSELLEDVSGNLQELDSGKYGVQKAYVNAVEDMEAESVAIGMKVERWRKQIGKDKALWETITRFIDNPLRYKTVVETSRKKGTFRRGSEKYDVNDKELQRIAETTDPNALERMYQTKIAKIDAADPETQGELIFLMNQEANAIRRRIAEVVNKERAAQMLRKNLWAGLGEEMTKLLTEKPELRRVIEEIKQSYDEILGEANREMAQLSGDEYLNRVEDYINRIYYKQGGISASDVRSLSSKHERYRYYDTIDEAEAAGLRLAETDAGKLLMEYSRSVKSATAKRLALAQVFMTRNASGDLMVIPEFNGVPADPPPLSDLATSSLNQNVANQAANLDEQHESETLWARLVEKAKSLSGRSSKKQKWVHMDSPFREYSGFMVHPDAVPVMESLLDERWTGTFIKKIEWVNTWSKWMTLGLSMFHPISIMENIVSIMGPSRAFRATKRGIKFAWNSDPEFLRKMENVEFVKDWIKHGLGTKPSPNVDAGMIAQDLLKVQQWAMDRKFRSVQLAAKGMLAYKDFVDRHLWQNFNSLSKLYAAEMFYQDRMTMLRESGSNINPDTGEVVGADMIKQEIAQAVNKAFGDMAYHRIMWATPKVRQLLRLLLFAPDWTLSNIEIARAGIAAIPGIGIPFQKGVSREDMRMAAFRVWPGMFIFMLGWPNVMQAIIYAAFGGDPDKEDKIFSTENETGKRFHVDVTPMYRALGWLSKDNPKERRYMQFAKQAWEVWDLVSNPLQTAKGKSSAIFKIAYEQVAGEDMIGRDAPWKKEEFWTGILTSEDGFIGSRAGAVMNKFLPMSVVSMLNGQPVAWLAPSSKGMTKGRTKMEMTRILDAYADPSTWAKISGTPDYERRLDKLVVDIAEAGKRNGVNVKEALKDAKSSVTGKYYEMFWRAMNSGDSAQMERAAESVIRLGAAIRGFHVSIAGKNKSVNRPYTSAEASLVNQYIAEARRVVTPREQHDAFMQSLDELR